MSFFKELGKIGSAVGDFLSGGVGTLVNAGASLIGGMQRNASAADQAQAANAFSAQQFASRYQTTVKDMQAAGLNPMLAYSQGAGGQPSGQQASVEDVISPAVSKLQQTRVNSAQIANVNADTENKKAQADLIAAQAAQAWSSAGQATANTELIRRNTEKVVEEIKNVPLEGERLRRLAQMIYEQGNLMYQQQLTEAQRAEVQKATIANVIADTGLKHLDIKAAEALDNLGRTATQLKPVIEIIKAVIGRR